MMVNLNSLSVHCDVSRLQTTLLCTLAISLTETHSTRRDINGCGVRRQSFERRDILDDAEGKSGATHCSVILPIDVLGMSIAKAGDLFQIPSMAVTSHLVPSFHAFVCFSFEID